MRAYLTPLIPWLMVLASCSAPPKPPTVDASRRHPVNAGVAIDLQVCRNELQNTRIMAVESGRLADSAAAALASAAAQQQMRSAIRDQEPPVAASNSVYTVRFEFGSSHVEIPSQAAQPLLALAKVAPLVLLRGRTDGASDTPAESRIARDRASAVRDYLVAMGVDPARIRATYQPAGDHVADNSSSAGRSLNRRVEIELYRTLPTSLSQATSAP